MLTNLFESRNKTFLNLVKLGDYLGRSLRENVELFSVDGDVVTYLTESGMVVRGSFDKSALTLADVIVEDSSAFRDKEAYNNLVNSKITNFLADILENDLTNANESFDSVLNIWETRLHFNRIQKRLQTKVEKFNENLNILNTPEFQRLTEIRKDLVAYLKESTNLINIPEIRNTVKLSSVISNSFNLPKITYEDLQESASFQIPQTLNHTLYEHLCKQELVAKEFVESKNSLENVWLTHEKVQKLPSFIYESDDNVMQLVSEIISEIPYFAMATKKQISSLIESNLDLLTERSVVPEKDIKHFVAKIFEFKKPVKNHILGILNEKYGINVQNLTDPITFDSLVKTQRVIFESLAKLSPKNSVMKRVLLEFSDLLKSKTGVESIDISSFLNEVFDEAEYTDSLNETHLMNYLNFDKVADDLGKIGQVLKMIQAGAGMGGAMGGAMGAAPGQAPTPTGPVAAATPPEMAGGPAGMAQDMPPGTEGEGEYESDGGDTAGMEEEGDVPPGIGDAEEAAGEVAAEEEGEEGDEESSLDSYEDDFEFANFDEKDKLVDNLKELDGLLAVLKDDMGLNGEGGGEEGEMPPEEGEGEGEEEIPVEDGEEDEEMMPSEEGSEGEDEGDDFGGEEESEGEEGEEESSEDDEEEEAPKKKGKVPFKK